jgi:V8-like Glu-specific endopeptidase
MLASLLIGMACNAWAEQSLRTLETMNESRAWAAVGRLELDGKGFCTGALIAPDLVLTAAHCLFDKDSQQPIPADRIEFLAGWRNGKAMAYRKVRRAVRHPRYDFQDPTANLRIANDVAILELRHPIKSGGVRPFRTAQSSRRGDVVGIVSYAAGRSEAPSLQEVCDVMEHNRQVLILSCEVEFGASGAPVFRFDADGPKIVSVISAKAELDGQRVAVGAPLENNLQVLWDELLAEDTRGFAPPPGATTVRVRNINKNSSSAGSSTGARAQSGVKFVKP